MREDQQVSNWLGSIHPDDRIITCTICIGETLFGIWRLPTGRRRTELEAKARQILAKLPIEPIPTSGGERYAKVKIDQQKKGLSLDEDDLWIATTPLVLGATLVSRDQDFHRIDLLPVVIPN